MDKKEPVSVSPYPSSPFNEMCPYEQRTGNCLAKLMCPFKHELNTSAMGFVPRKDKRGAPAPVVPSPVQYYPQPQLQPQYPPVRRFDSEEAALEELDEFDPMEFVEQFKDCPCCHGHVYGCSGDVCKDLGVCYCKAGSEAEAP